MMLLRGMLLFCWLMLYSCGIDGSQVPGKYVDYSLVNTKDTLILDSAGTFHRRIYDSSNSLLLVVEGTWKLRGVDRVDFDGLFRNPDSDTLSVDWVRQNRMAVSTYFEQRNGHLSFSFGNDMCETYFEKVP